ncbi:MAG: J domain-containing protein [Alphaproteobacteria bacterium]|nr:MAG: J domain-containing protein [Alphaproteobacteria bacterium]
MHHSQNPYLELERFDTGAGRKRSCDHPDCPNEGRFRAPRSRDRLNDYYWFCLDHVRDYNAQWNYFAEMSEQEIDRYRRDEASWHRPTWPMGGRGPADIHLNDPLDIFAGLDAPQWWRRPNTRPDGRPLNAADRRALARLGLDASATRDDIRRAYKRLVKRYHPDANGGDRKGEDTFKAITEAYRHLRTDWPER